MDWENKDGIQAAVRIVSATTPDEALGLINRHNVAFIVIPSWDPQLDAFARLGLGQLQGSLIDGLHHWAVPPWLRPIPYPLPAIGGFDGQSVVLFEVVEEQDDPTLMSRLAAFFVEMGYLDLAGAVEHSLQRFPSDLGAIVGRAQVENARGEKAAFARTVETLVPRLSGTAENDLLWDRRVDLAVVLAQGQHIDQSRQEVRRCLADADAGRLRALSIGSLYHLEVLMKAFGLKIADPDLHQLALNLLPPDLRARITE